MLGNLHSFYSHAGWKCMEEHHAFLTHEYNLPQACSPCNGDSTWSTKTPDVIYSYDIHFKMEALHFDSPHKGSCPTSTGFTRKTSYKTWWRFGPGQNIILKKKSRWRKKNRTAWPQLYSNLPYWFLLTLHIYVLKHNLKLWIWGGRVVTTHNGKILVTLINNPFLLWCIDIYFLKWFL